MTEFVWQFGERLRVIRKRAKLNQDQFGEILGVSRQTIISYNRSRADKLAHILMEQSLNSMGPDSKIEI